MNRTRQNAIDKAVSWLLPQRGLKRLLARTRYELALQYRGADSTRLRADWILGKSESTPSAWELSTLRERSRDLSRNDPVASGANDTMTINIVGQGLKPQSRIRAEYLNIAEDQAKELMRQAESIWQEWSGLADAANRMDFNEIQFVALRKVIEDGEIVALPIMAKEPWRRIKRAIELIEAHRLTGGGIAMATGNDSGIEVGERGEPLAYYIEKANHQGKGKNNSVKISARDTNGRPKILHIFPTRRPGQLRGVPFFAPVLTYFKDLSDYLEAEVVTARVAACLAVFVTADDPHSLAHSQASDTETDTSHRLQTLEPGMIDYLAPGESINIVDPKRPGDSFAPFVESVLRLIGMALNLPYELLVKDFSKTNYSSARAALLEGRRMFLNWRSWFARKFCQPIWELILEEAYLRDLFKAPDFYTYKSEYCRALWLGGGWGWVDPVKEVEASRKAIDYGLSTMAEEAAGQGRDWEEILEQKAREDQKIDELGIKIMRSAKGDGNAKPQEE